MHKPRGGSKNWISELSMGKLAARLLVTLLTIALALVGAVVLGFVGAHLYLRPEIPEAAELRDIRLQLPLSIYSQDGLLMAQIGEQRRLPVTWEEIPPVVVDAFLAAEDDRYFQHPGVDWHGLVRAARSNLTAGAVREGGGTITMQLARNTVLGSERTLRRKLKEVFLALRLEREFSKQEILTRSSPACRARPRSTTRLRAWRARRTGAPTSCAGCRRRARSGRTSARLRPPNRSSRGSTVPSSSSRRPTLPRWRDSR